MENIQVVLRVRPQNPHESESHDPEIWQVYSSNTIAIDPTKQDDLIRSRKIGIGHRTQFSFNHCFSQTSTNLQIYESVVKRIAMSSLKGINGTIFMYGQTGSGKTFTMIGPHAHDNYQSHFHEAPKELSTTPRGTRTAESSMTGKAFKTFSVFDHEKPFDNSSKSSIPKSLTMRTRSPMVKREKTPTNRTSEKSPLPISRTQKSPFRKDSIANITIDLNLDKTQSDDDNINFGKYINHKRSCTIQLSQNMKKSPERSSHTTADNSQVSQHYEMDTMRNHPENKEGILVLALKDIFNEIEKETDKRFFLRCSYLEIYTDLVFDLLKSQDKLHEVLTINEDTNKEFYIKGATEEIVSSLDDILNTIRRGEANRHYASTAMNHASSRSHTIFRLYVQSFPANLDSPNSNYITESILNFVDLAGSEKVDIHDAMRIKSKETFYSTNLKDPNCLTPNAHKERVKESQHINKSLFFLTQVISLKSQGKPDLFIPYRNSPLTKILRSSLGGNSRTAIVLCVNPSLSQTEQTMSTLRFGLNAKKIENKVQANVISDANDETLKNLLKEYERKITDMEREKNKDKTTSEQLMQVIQKLQEQKNTLAERLLMLKRSEILNSSFVNLTKGNRKNYKWEHLHYENVGILHVLTNKEEDKDKPTYDFEGKYALQSLKNMKQQNTILENKVQKLKEKVEEFEKERAELIDTIMKKDKLIAKKRTTVQQLKKKCAQFHIENDKLKQIVSFYQNQNHTGLQKLSVDTLSKIEKNLILLLDSIKLNKSLKTICKKLPQELGDNEHTKVFQEFLFKMGETDPITKAQGIDIEFDENFFELTPLNFSSSKKCRILDAMQNDPNIPLSVKCSIDPKVSYNCREQSQMSPQAVNFNSFQNYFSVYKKEKNMLEAEEMDSLDNKLAKLRGSYQKIIDMIKTDNYNEVLSKHEGSELKELDTNSLDFNSQEKAQFTSPRIPPNKLHPSYHSITKNLNEELSFSALMSVNASIENNENTNLMNLLNSTEYPKLEKPHSEIPPKSDPIKIEGEHIKLQPSNVENNTGQRYKFACLNL